MSQLRIAIIGAGPCGLSQLLAFKQAEQEQRVELVCFERQSDWGGLWLYTSQTGIDVHGEPVHSSMYRHLWSNSPKELIEYPDYTFHDHFGCDLPSFLPRTLMYDYITSRARVNDLRRFIRFHTAVRYVDFDDEKNEFNVEVEDFNTGVTECFDFDRVIVASGHYHTPNMIHVDGVDQFSGRVLRAHDFRGADEFVDLNLLLVGGGWSAEDIAIQCYKFNARSITISSRQELVAYKWPDKIKTAPMLVRLEGRKAHFKDGSTVDNIDAIIFCTGYRHHYPFMAKRFRLESGVTQFVPSTLYKSIFWIDQPNLAYLGAPRQFYSFSMFEFQAALVRDVFLGYVELPDRDQWKADIGRWRTRENSLGPVDFSSMLDLQRDYLDDIYRLFVKNETHQSLSKFDYKKVNEVVKQYCKNKLDDVLHYRDVPYESIIDPENAKAAPVLKPWIENMDDSLEDFLSHYRKE